jgi:GTP-binding protein
MVFCCHGHNAGQHGGTHLMNYFRKSLDVMGTPIRIQFKEGENPFANKRNTLTPNQMRKRKRLIKHIKKSK